ncbi:hypothetical protein [Streptomyces sp. NPDC056192]|uniref:hypothetical protein n=1 Tax=Streptomyces sp. NPDC056192 TaxID=3345743 RepID=UPI0035DD87F3
MAGKPLFSGLSVAHDPTSAEIYAENFYREQAAQSARAHIKTPPTPPSRRVMPGDRPAGMPVPAAIKDVTTRSSKYGVRASVGTPSVPAGLRKSAGETLRPKSTDGRRKTRAAAKTRDKGTQKIVYNSRVGMTAQKRMTPEIRDAIEMQTVARTLATIQQRENTRQESARVAREDAKSQLAAAIGRERDAMARGDIDAAKIARAEIRQARKASKFNKGA